MDAQSVVIGYALGYNDGLDNGEGKPSDDWSPPDWWIPVPEPEEYEIYLLVQVFNAGNSAITVVVSRPADANTGCGNLAVDWGDGTANEWEGSWSDLRHTYTDTGQYLIKITTADESCFLQNIYGGAQLLIARLGSKIVLNNHIEWAGQQAFRNKYYLKWVDYRGDGDLPNEQAFSNCFALRKLTLAKPLTELTYKIFSRCYNLNFNKIDFSQVTKIGNNALEWCYGLSKINLPECMEIGENAFYECLALSKLYAQICETVGNYAFDRCYNLQEIVVSEDCVFGNGCFSNCFSFFPRPDGSTN